MSGAAESPARPGGGLGSNRLRELLDRKPVLIGAMVNTPSPRLVEVCGHAGFDWLFVDGEHEMVDLRAAYDLCTAADAVGVPIAVRVPSGRPELLLGFAEAGAHCVVVPHVQDRTGAEAIVRDLAYPPLGRRGVHSRTRASNYGMHLSPVDYFALDGSHAMPMAMIEDAAAIEGIEEIVHVDGLDLFLVGPGDISGSLGVPGQLQHPEVVAHVERAMGAISRAGKVAGVLASTPESAAAYAKMGARMIMCSTGALSGNAFHNFLKATGSLLA
ncbi:HpcH/HpaI aldolase family protein [Specibacter sp. RAF43]|uniref:HpcH/HpaI aldolase family protein n=1 Tax=Specibacter sp. RAF43 TaxID=3233057 RepID=UPI003F97FD40